jgi:uncharacterized protein YijF (DUF1287 family)
MPARKVQGGRLAWWVVNIHVVVKAAIRGTTHRWGIMAKVQRTEQHIVSTHAKQCYHVVCFDPKYQSLRRPNMISPWSKITHCTGVLAGEAQQPDAQIQRAIHCVSVAQEAGCKVKGSACVGCHL